MGDDLVLGSPDDSKDIQEEEEYIYEGPSDTEYIHALCVAYDTVLEVSAMTKADQSRIDRIKEKSIKLLDYLITKKYNEVFNIKN